MRKILTATAISIAVILVIATSLASPAVTSAHPPDEANHGSDTVTEEKAIPQSIRSVGPWLAALVGGAVGGPVGLVAAAFLGGSAEAAMVGYERPATRHPGYSPGNGNQAVRHRRTQEHIRFHNRYTATRTPGQPYGP